MVPKFKLEEKKVRIYFEDLLYRKLCHDPLPDEWQLPDECNLTACIIILYSAWQAKVWP